MSRVKKLQGLKLYTFPQKKITKLDKVRYTSDGDLYRKPDFTLKRPKQKVNNLGIIFGKIDHSQISCLLFESESTHATYFSSETESWCRLLPTNGRFGAA